MIKSSFFYMIIGTILILFTPILLSLNYLNSPYWYILSILGLGFFFISDYFRKKKEQ